MILIMQNKVTLLCLVRAIDNAVEMKLEIELVPKTSWWNNRARASNILFCKKLKIKVI
jgi:hypothetical protein